MNTEELAKRIIETHRQSLRRADIRLTDLFKEELKGGKLHLDGINFLALQFILVSETEKVSVSHIDFSNCIFSNCDFSHVQFHSCNFTDSQFAENNSLIDVYADSATEKKGGAIFCRTEDLLSDEGVGMNAIRSSYLRDEKLQQRLWDQYPDFYFNYSYQLILKNSSFALLNSDPEIINEVPFLSFDYDTEQMIGWKLHFAVIPENLDQAFPLIAPIISRYCRHFKIIIKDLYEQDKLLHVLETSEHEDFPCYSMLAKTTIESREHMRDIIPKYVAANQRVYRGAQITLYLEGPKETISPDHVEKMLKEVDAVLVQHHIQPSILPSSDAPTISPYFSLRNDKVVTKKMYGLYETKINYIPAKFVGTNFNPLNFSNPYQHLLLHQTEKFDLVKHFQSLPKAKVPYELLRNLVITMFAYLSEYTLLHSDDSHDHKKVIKALSFFLPPDDSFPKKLTKKEYRNNEEILKGINVAGRFFPATFSDLIISEPHSQMDINQYKVKKAKKALQFPDHLLNAEFTHLKQIYENELKEICKRDELSGEKPVTLCIPGHLFHANDPMMNPDESYFPKNKLS